MSDMFIIDANAGNVGLSEFAHQQFGATVIEHLYAHNDALGMLINTRIKLRTPVLTAALVSSEKYEVNTDPSSEDMVVFYADDAEQLAEWQRVYVAYQEGGELGLPTYTNEPHEMYAKVETEDVPAIQSWGYTYLEEGLNVLAEGQGRL